MPLYILTTGMSRNRVCWIGSLLPRFAWCSRSCSTLCMSGQPERQLGRRNSGLRQTPLRLEQLSRLSLTTRRARAQFGSCIPSAATSHQPRRSRPTSERRENHSIPRTSGRPGDGYLKPMTNRGGALLMAASQTCRGHTAGVMAPRRKWTWAKETPRGRRVIEIVVVLVGRAANS
jgi:hypothetical protein